MPYKVNVLDKSDEIVITGVSGQYPNCKNVNEFEYNLYNKINMVDDRETRWAHIYPGIPKVQGKIPRPSKFDATFFGIHQGQADNMDVQMRIIVEEAYKAVMDAGVNPSSLRNSNTGVYIGACASEADIFLMYCENSSNGFGLLGASKSLLANRISFVLGLNGPSMACDTACSSSMYALNLAYEHMKNGMIDAAIVGGANVLICPYVTAKFAKLGILSMSGNSRPLDDDANGYIRSEAVSCIFLQRRRNAKRIYATLIKSAINCDGFKAEGLTYPSGNMQKKLLEQFYGEDHIDINELGYIEAHSTGTVAGDAEECRAIDEAICKKRNKPLLIGTVKSNCGHAEGASGVVSITKAILILNNNCIPPNINFSKPRKTIKGIIENRLAVVTETTVLQGPYVCVNSFGFGGANAHALLKQETTEHSVPSYGSQDDLPYLFTWSSRTESNTYAVFDYLESRLLNLEHLSLLRSSQKGGIKGMMYRGYNILKPICGTNISKTASLSKDVQFNEGVKCPITWVFSGMGSQWVGMGKDLMKIKSCAESILKCHEVLKSKDIDLVKILTSDDPEQMKSSVHSFVGITAIQIALVDLLQMLGMQPNYIIGHSLGEVGCAYADGCLTTEQTILASYYRGKVSSEMEKTWGSMAAVGLGFKDIQKILPCDIDVACHNSNESCTISGPIEEVSRFVEDIKSKKIFAKEVPCYNVAYHSRYIQHFGPALTKHMKDLIPNPKLRSNKWISTSFPSDMWQLPESKYCSPEYQVKNLLSSVLFEEGATYLPKNSLTIEIAPHALLQSILKTCNPDGMHIGMTRRNVKNNDIHLLESLGKLYIHGCELSLEKLYPPITWPVSRGTPTISNLVQLDNSQDYNVPYFEDECMKTGNKVIVISPNSEHKYLLGHEIDGKTLVPATFYLESVWKTFALTLGILDFETVNVEFENVRFLRATTLSSKDIITLQVSIQQGTGAFEITESKTLVVSGLIRRLSEKTEPPSKIQTPCSDEVLLPKKDLYKELKLRGYHYNGDFQSVELANGDGSYGRIKWFNNWVSFIDCMLQLSIIRTDSRHLALPVKLRSMRILASYHVTKFRNNCEIDVRSDGNRIVSGGVEIVDLKTSQIQRRKPPGDPVLEKYQFIPNFGTVKLSSCDIFRCSLQTFLENVPISQCFIVQAASSVKDNLMLLKELMEGINDLPIIQGHYFFLNMGDKKDLHKSPEWCDTTNIKYFDSPNEIESSIDILLADENNISSTLLSLAQRISVRSMLLIKTNNRKILEEASLHREYIPIALFPCSNRPFSILSLLKKSALDHPVDPENEVYIKVSQNDKTFQWIDLLKRSYGKQTVIVEEHEPHSGIIGLVNCLRKEPETQNVRCMFIDDNQAPKFDPTVPFYSNQLKLGLAMNVYRQGQWGSYRHLQLKQLYPVVEQIDHICGAIGNIGDFSTLHWQKAQINESDVKIRISYSALNFRDVMHASGRLSADDIGLNRFQRSLIFGLEYSGIDEHSGKAVMGMALHSAIASHMKSKAIISWEVPSRWSLREAATVPVVYTTVYYSFFYKVDIRKGKDILIHSGSGGIGIAAIRTAIAYGLEVYTTVSTVDKRNFLLQTFPELKEENIGNSRDCSFEEMIRIRTNGKGVDFILNSLSEEKLKASLRCLAPNGHFLEIGKFDMANDSSIGLGAFFHGQLFHAVLADKLGDYYSHLIDKIRNHIADDIEKGIVQPLPSTVFKPAELEQAFRYLMMAKHIGKVIIEIRSDISSLATHPVAAVPKVYFNEELVYVVSGGLGGFGLELVDWMILRGARKIVLSSRRGLSDQYQNLRISKWKSYNCHIRVNTSDITTEGGCLELLNGSMGLGSIGGIFNLAVLLKDGLFPNQTMENFQQSLEPKSIATKYLDKLSRKLCPKLHWFVVFSSVACGRGNAGQTNYGMANSIMERIVEERVQLGYPGKAIQWGAVGEVGLASVMVEGKIDVNIGGTLQQRISSCLVVLDALLISPDPVVSSMVVAEKKFLPESQTALQFVMSTLSLTQLKSVSINSTLSELGMDSLMGVEIKQTLERDFDIVLTPAELRTLTIDRLKQLSELHKKKSIEYPNNNNNNENYISNFLEILYLNVAYKSVNPEILLPLNNFNSDEVPVIMFPGVESMCSQIWENIGSKLKAPAYCVQLSAKVGTESFISLIKIIVSEISNILKNRRCKTFRVVAHSFGTLVAHIVTKYLENLGFSGSMVYIDGSPAWVENICKEIKATDVLEVKKRVLLLAMKSLANEEQMESFTKIVAENQIMEVIYWNIKQNLNLGYVDECMRFLTAVMATTETVLDLNTYKLVPILDSKILVIKPTISVQLKIDEFYGLKPITRNVIDVSSLEGDHHTILLNKQVPELLNNYFGMK